MSQQPGDRIFVRDSERSLCWQACDPWDRTTMLACLSSDPRSLEELALAWSRYRPNQPLMELQWSESHAPPEAGEWLAIDLTTQRYAWRAFEEDVSEPGCYQPDGVNVDGRNRRAWINVPPWWQQVAVEQWSFASSQPARGNVQQEAAEHQPTHSDAPSVPSEALRSPLDFRSVLYGQSLVEYIAAQALGAKAKAGSGSSTPLSEKWKREAALSEAEQRARSRDGLTVQERAQVRRWEKAAKRIHARWLMTPRAELGGKRPRWFLHAHRQWKDRELDYRRSQWSRERRPPPPAPRTSHLFRFGPMGIEEVTTYFDLCRRLIGTALQIVDDEPGIVQSQLVERLESARQEWLASEAMEGDCLTVQEVIDGDRQLLPRLASSEPFDCDCPLCRVNAVEPDLFGPAFWMCDTFREDMEEEFPFSLHAKREDWEQAREEWLCWSAAPRIERDSANDDNGGDGHDGGDEGGAKNRSGEWESAAPDDSDSAWTNVWQSSGNDMSHGNPRLSLLGIGAHLSEIIDELKRLGAAREEIDRLNGAYDELLRSLRRWLTRDSANVHVPEFGGFEPVATQMTGLLEAMALDYPELTARSADLQSQIHQWQRQLSPMQDG